MGKETCRSFTRADPGGHPARGPRPGRLLRLLEITAVLLLSAVVTCSREPAPHEGEWSGQLYYRDFTNSLEVHLLFDHDGRVVYQRIASRGAIESRDGVCRIEYDHFPPRMHLEFRDGTSLHGLVHFFGRDKTMMHIGIVSDGPPGPYSESKEYLLLTKIGGKSRAAPE